MYRITRECEYYRVNCMCEVEMMDCDETKTITIAYFTSLYEAIRYCEKNTQTVKLDIGDGVNVYVFCIDKMLVDENGAFTKTDENFNCRIYSDKVKYIGE